MVERPAAYQWRELAILERIDSAVDRTDTALVECETTKRPSLTVIVAASVMGTALVCGAAIVGLELIDAFGF